MIAEDETAGVDATAPLPQVTTISASGLSAPFFHLDAKYYRVEINAAKATVARWREKVRRLGEIASATVPPRLKLITVGNANAGAPYLQAHDAFLAYPEAHRFVSRTRTPHYDKYLLREGTLLTPSSGRNLGPLTFVGRFLTQFAMTDIMRITPHSPDDAYYLLGYLLTTTGQALIRRGRTGSNVDHLNPSEVEDVEVVWFEDQLGVEMAAGFRQAEEALDQARESLRALEDELHELCGLPLPLKEADYIGTGWPHCFAATSGSLTGRLDAAFYDSTAAACRETIAKTSSARLDQVADLLFLDRYKRYYVSSSFGRPILSGRQLLQLRPVNLRYISDRSFTRPEEYLIHSGWCLFPCRGRMEGALGNPAFVYSARNQWLASEHIMRAVPRGNIHAGYLYLALRSPYVQTQLKVRPTGSVVDVLDPATVGDVLLPMLTEPERRVLGQRVVAAWEAISRAAESERQLAERLEARLSG